MDNPRDRFGFIWRPLRLKDLRVFLAVARAGSMARAADELDLSQPAISALISDLEHSLRAKLFERHARGVRLTQYGSVLLQRGIRVFDELSQGFAEIENLANATVGEVRLGCPESICAAFLPRLLEEFKRKCPGIVVYVE